jgi:hypothetical protein
VGLKAITWIGSFAVIFLFLPSLALKIWDFLVTAPWQYKSWLVYLVVAVFIIMIARSRFRKKKNAPTGQGGYDSLLLTAKQRLAKGEISLEEFREIRQELKLE